MSTFEWDGDTYPTPEGWSGLSIEDWFYKLESLRDKLMNADDLDLEPMQDEDGDDLDPEDIVLIQSGFKSGGHYENFRNWGVSQWAAETGESFTDVEFRVGAIAREKIMAEKAGAMTGQGGGGGGLDPVEGVDLNAWAALQAGVAGGGDVDQLIAGAGMDRPKWDRVSAEWNARMATDTTAAIATAYGNAFAGAGAGQFGGAAAQAAAAGVGGDVGAEPIPFERYVEIMEAQSAGADKGQDAGEILASFGLSPMDWGNVGMYWSKKQAQEATKYHRLFTEYSEKYKAKYA